MSKDAVTHNGRDGKFGKLHRELPTWFEGAASVAAKVLMPPWMDVIPSLSKDIENLMVAEKSDNTTTALRCLVSEPLKKIPYALFLGATVQEVTELHQSCITASPAARIIDDSCKLQDVLCCLQVSMEVTDCNDAARRIGHNNQT
mmetsp:Transcript_16946/g.43537  ORF Transcript_16946/g.43537 Transcript_16946/m.43537 type:complete len:145 (+) Transcript_16946:648-1082(+)